MATYDAGEPPPYSPRLTDDQVKEAEQATSAAAPVIHEAIRLTGDQELARPVSALAWSGLAAGLSMGFSLVTEGLLRAALPAEAPWALLLTKLGYSVGFVIVILGRQQLFTENTLTAVLPLLARRDAATLVKLLRLWAVVLLSNLAGTLIFATVIAHTAVFDPHNRATFAEIGRQAAEGTFWTILIRGIFAGWLIATVVWLQPSADTARLWIIILLTWLVGVAQLSHIIAGSVEVMYVAVIGQLSWSRCVLGYTIPTLIGNTIGGVALVAVLNHAQVVAGANHQGSARAAKADRRPQKPR